MMNIDDIRGSVARGWCRPETSSKVMDPDLAEAIAQQVHADLSSPLGAVVKPLEWQRDSLPNSAPQRYRAEVPGGMGDYSVTGSERKNEWQWFRNGYFADGHKHHKAMTIEAAQAASQADYETRILAALQPPSHAALLAAALKLPEVAALVDKVKAEITARHLYENIQADRGMAHGPKGQAFAAWQRSIAELFATLTALEARHEDTP